MFVVYLALVLLVKLSENVSNLNEGEVLEITSTDKGFYSDVEALCDSIGNKLLNLDTIDKKIIATIQKGNLQNKNRIIET